MGARIFRRRPRIFGPQAIRWRPFAQAGRLLAQIGGTLVLGAASFAAAQEPPPIKRIPLQKYDVPGTSLETVIGIAEVTPNVLIGRHTYPGPEAGYLLEGEFVLMIEGQPEKALKSGESYQVPSGAIHDAKSGARGAKVLAVYIVRKGEPLATPAK